MIIESISLKNFLCFRNEKISFGPKSNIILGRNRTGKSKIFDAFNWILFDKIWFTNERKWFNTKKCAIKILNNEEFNNSKDGKNLYSSVELVFSSNKKKYTLHKEICIMKSNNERIYDGHTVYNLKIKHNSETITYDKKDSFNAHINRVINSNISKYILFQGEAVNDLVSISKDSQFTKAVNGIFKKGIFELAYTRSKDTLKRIRTDHQKLSESDLRNKSAINLLTKQIDTAKKEITEFETQLTSLSSEIKLIKEKFTSKNNELKKIQGFSHLIQEIDNTKKQKKLIQENINNIIKNEYKNIISTWMYAGTSTLFTKFQKLYNENKEKGQFPEPVTLEFLKEMIDKKKCLVCGTDAKESSNALKQIEKLIEKRLHKSDMEHIVGLGFSVSSVLNEKIKPIKNQINEIRTDYSKKTQEYEDLNYKLSQLEEELSEHGSGGRLDVKSIQKMKDARIKLENDLSNRKKQHDQIESKLVYIKGNRNTYLTERDRLLKKTTSTIDNRKLDIAKDVVSTLEVIMERFDSEILDQIEISSNTVYKDMLKNAVLDPSTIKIDRQKKRIYLIDQDTNEELTNINQGNMVAMQIAFIASIIQTANEKWGDEFPLITDAPTSDLDSQNVSTSIKTIINTFGQSIILLKDDENESLNRELNNLENVSTFYRLEPENQYSSKVVS
tara:strand:- start:377 stop:2392 length:2016 start_codon:yes stop_codon:yes gene_type:complete